MGFKKLTIAVNCKDAKEQAEVQSILDELSNVLRLEATDVISAAPMLRKNQSVIYKMFKTISSGGAGKIMSIIPLAFQIKR